MPAEAIHKTSEVFGTSRHVPLNYVSRTSTDDVLLGNLSRHKHLVIHGSSKQGKTCLRKKCLIDNAYILVHCSNKWSLTNLHSAILKASGFEISDSKTKTIGGKYKIEAKAKGQIPFLTSGELGGEIENSSSEAISTQPLTLDVDDVNDVIAALSQIGFDKLVVLEDFHYLDVETQKDFSIALKAFHENSGICFVIVGVWPEKDKLTSLNGDLTGRVVSINTDTWTKEELAEVIKNGEFLLNVEFDRHFKTNLINMCNEGVQILQEACYRCCDIEEVRETLNTKRVIGGNVDAEILIREVVNEQSGRFKSFLDMFADGYSETDLDMYRWILYPILKASVQQLEIGIRLSTFQNQIRDAHPSEASLPRNSVPQALKKIAGLQSKKNLTPFIFTYDQGTSILSVVDRSFLIWLSMTNRAELLDDLNLPST